MGVAFWAIGSAVSAQEVDSTVTTQKSSWGDANEISDYIPDISLDARFGYGYDFAEDAGRFGGNGLFLDINGKIAPNIYYSLNHRLANFEGSDEPGFGNTNWLTLSYDNDSFFVTAGKEDIKVGSFEYDEYEHVQDWLRLYDFQALSKKYPVKIQPIINPDYLPEKPKHFEKEFASIHNFFEYTRNYVKTD